MGMGEPLYNFENVKAAMAVAADPDALSFSKRRITLSTSGVVPMIERAGAEMGLMLAISLHAVRDELRDELVPINRKYPIAELSGCLPHLSGAFQCAANHLRICHVEGRERYHRRGQGAGPAAGADSGEDQFNSLQSVARRRALNARIGRRSNGLRISSTAPGYASPIRTPRGRDIMAACGQLKSASEKMRASALRGLSEAPV